jgi:peptidoglycan/xylan/chitin deacetylase (PgdA/CDA1 family)
VLALTFDDGPDPLWTPAILDALAAEDAPATLFVLTEKAAAHPELIAR